MKKHLSGRIDFRFPEAFKSTSNRGLTPRGLSFLFLDVTDPDAVAAESVLARTLLLPPEINWGFGVNFEQVALEAVGNAWQPILVEMALAPQTEGHAIRPDRIRSKSREPISVKEVRIIFFFKFVLPLVFIYRKQYGLRAATYITGVFFLSMVGAGIIVDALFAAHGFDPAGTASGKCGRPHAVRLELHHLAGPRGTRSFRGVPVYPPPERDRRRSPTRSIKSTAMNTPPTSPTAGKGYRLSSFLEG